MPTVLPTSPLKHWLRLAFEPRLGHAAYTLLRDVGPPATIFTAGADVLRQHIGADTADRLSRTPDPDLAKRVDRACTWADITGHAILTLDDAAYPPHLLTLADPPLVLFVAGHLDVLQRPGLAIVGARSATAQGLANARGFARVLARQHVAIVSGLAHGIDAAAHQGALDAGPTGAGTIAVMGTGMDTIYPTQHRALAERIMATGALVSELPLDAGPRRFHFPRRNRLVAGLARGVLVVEAAPHSGSLITARLAADTGREVFAIPGSIHSPLSRGCHALLRQGAKLVETAQDILDELPGVQGAPTHSAPHLTPFPQPSIGQPPPTANDPILHALGFDPVTLDTLATRSNMDIPTLAAHLFTLEMANKIIRLPDGTYQQPPPDIK